MPFAGIPGTPLGIAFNGVFLCPKFIPCGEIPINIGVYWKGFFTITKCLIDRQNNLCTLLCGGVVAPGWCRTYCSANGNYLAL